MSAPFAALYDPTSGNFRMLSPALNQDRMNHTSTLLPDGRVLIAAGRGRSGDTISNLATAEIFDPKTLHFTMVSGGFECPGPSGCMTASRAFHTATGLIDGRVFLSGGLSDDQGTSLTTTEYSTRRHLRLRRARILRAVCTPSAFLRAPSTIALQVPASPAPIDQRIVLTATVTVKYSQALTGTVSFDDGDDLAG